MAQKRERRGYELKALFWGRPIRPFHLAVFISTGAVGITNLDGAGTVLSGATSYVVGGVASISAILLITGWWFKKDVFAEWGLLLAAGMWASRATFAFLSHAHNEWFTIAISFAWFVGAAGAYLLERYDHVISDRE